MFGKQSSLNLLNTDLDLFLVLGKQQMIPRSLSEKWEKGVADSFWLKQTLFL